MAKSTMADRSIAIAEAQRDATPHEGFFAGLFEGEARLDQIFPYPEQTPEDRAKADPVLAALRDLFLTLDVEAIRETGEIPGEFIDELTKLGMFGIKIPEAFGGLGFSQTNYGRIAVLVGSVDGSVAAFVSAHNSIGASQPLLEVGTSEQQARYFPEIAAGAICAFALTEREAGSDLTRIRTYALRVRDSNTGAITGYDINGEKIYTTNGPKNETEPLAKYILVVARIVDDPAEIDDPDAEQCFGVFIVDTDSPGFSIGGRSRFMGMPAIYNGPTVYDHVFVATEDMLGEEGDGIRIALGTLAIGRLTLPKACLGGMKQMLSLSRWRANTRIQWFNTSLAKKELIAEKIANIAANLFALQAMVDMTCLWVDQKRDVRLESAVLKVLGSEWLWEAADETLQIWSGRGYETAESLRARGEVPIFIGGYLDDARVNRIFEGTNEVMYLWTGREGMDPYKRFGEAVMEGSFSEKLRALFELAKRAVAPKRHGFSDETVPQALRPHLKFVEREARKLARAAIVSAVVWKEGLAHRQLVIKELVLHASNLFAIASTVSYATALVEEHGDDVIELADYFCWEARNRINPPRGLFAKLFRNPNKGRAYRLTQRIAAGDYAWLEDGALLLREQHDVV